MKSKIVVRLERAKTEIDTAKRELAYARELGIEYKIREQKDNYEFWNGYLTALEELDEEISA